MKKRVLALILVLAFALGITAFAAEQATAIRPSLNFSGTTAHCVLNVTDAGAEITATLELYYGGTKLRTWTGSGESYLSIGGTHTVVKGNTYLLIAYGDVDGVPFYETVTGTC